MRNLQVQNMLTTTAARICAWINEQTATSSLEPTPEELANISAACNRLWQLGTSYA